MEPYQQLEADFGKFVKNPNVVACSSGTAALHLALEALQLPLGSSVIVPEFTMVACARAVTLAGHKPIFVDCNSELLIDPDLIEGSIETKTRAIMPVHIYGRQCDMNAVHAIAAKYGLVVIEDCSEAHGGIEPHYLTEAACWSFYRNKIICGEEGGAIAFKSSEQANIARRLRSLGFTEAHDFVHEPRGHNYRMSNAHASLILKSLAEVDDNLKDRLRVEDWYNDETPDEWRMPYRQVCWVYDVRIPKLSSPDQDVIVKALNVRGVAARHGFKAMSRQPEYMKWYQDLNAHLASREIIYLPVRPTMQREEVQRNMELLRSTVADVIGS